MNRVILIKYGELTTKKGNRGFFVKTLYNNVLNKLKGLEINIFKDNSRMYIEFNDSELEEVINRIKEIFGIHLFHVAYKIDLDLDSIKSTIVEIAKLENFKTFKVETKRSNKKFSLDSMELSRLLGGVILKNIDSISVDVHNPDVLYTVEIRDKDCYIYTNAYKGCGGYPVGTQPKSLLMLSGGIDSPVAGYLAMKRGIKIEAVYFEAIPHTSLEARNKVIKLCSELNKYGSNIILHVVPFTAIQEEIYKVSDPSYCITIMRRMMYRIMEKLAKKQKALAIVNGESIGQVASQTLTSMSIINSVTNMPVIRPVACLDKLEIIDIAKKINTYETSILPFEDCCTVFVPKHPVINPLMDTVLDIESKFDYEEMINLVMGEIFTIKTKEQTDEKFDDLF